MKIKEYSCHLVSHLLSRPQRERILTPLNLTPRVASPSRRHLMMKRDQPCNICRKQSKYITDNLLSNISDQLLPPASPPAARAPPAEEIEGKAEHTGKRCHQRRTTPRGPSCDVPGWGWGRARRPSLTVVAGFRSPPHGKRGSVLKENCSYHASSGMKHRHQGTSTLHFKQSPLQEVLWAEEIL